MLTVQALELDVIFAGIGVGELTINGGGSGTIVANGFFTVDGFTFNGENMANGRAYFSAGQIVNISGDVTFNYGQGANAFMDVENINTGNAFTLNGTNLVTGNISIGTLSATQNINMDFGGMSGNATFGNIYTEGEFVLNASNASNFGLDIESLSVGTGIVTLGAVYDYAHANSISAISANSFTLHGESYRENFEIDRISAENVSLSFGDLSDGFFASSISTDTFSFSGGDGPNFSAYIGNLSIGASDFDVTMPELGNSLTIASLCLVVQVPSQVRTLSTLLAQSRHHRLEIF